jgi:predicted RNA-binding protein
MRTLVMPEAARILVTGEGVVCFDIAGGRKTVEGAVLAEADLMRHQIILMPKQS